eukprot:14715546-Ditylum_brightwellii.AAC.1
MDYVKNKAKRVMWYTYRDRFAWNKSDMINGYCGSQFDLDVGYEVILEEEVVNGVVSAKESRKQDS